MLQVVVGHSTEIDSADAIDDALSQCHPQLQGNIPQAALLFIAVDFEYDIILQRLQREFPGIQVIGGTTDGEVSSIQGFQEDSLSLTLLYSDSLTLHATVGRNIVQDAKTATQSAIDAIPADDLANVKLCLVIPEGIRSGVESVLDQLKQLLPSNTPIVGGRSADQFQFQQTYQFFNSEVLDDAAPMLLFCGDLHVSHGVASGWEPVSRKVTVTRANGPTVYEIEHQPAADFYKDYLGDLPITGEYPLTVFEADSDRTYLRAANQWGDEAGSILFMGNVPEQATVQIAHATSEKIIQATEQAITQAVESYPGRDPSAALIFSCAARRWMLGSRVQEEYELGKQFLDPTIPVSGFYTYGEISPLVNGGTTHYHQETFVVVLLGTE